MIPASSQAGLGTFSRYSAGPGAPVVRIPQLVRYCPTGHPITSRYEGQPDGDSIPIDECRTCGWKEDR